MDINQIISRAASVYPDAYVLNYWDTEQREPQHNPLGGDTLAQFIALELAETYDGEASDEEQITEAVRVMQRAADDLVGVARAIQDMLPTGGTT